MASEWSKLTVDVIRHAHRADKEPDYDGGGNTPLSSRGHEQAHHLADHLSEKQFSAIYSSCHLRALQTAAPLAEATGVEWHAWPVFGEFANRTWRQLVADDDPAVNEVATWQKSSEAPGTIDEPLATMDGNYYLVSDLPSMFSGIAIDQPFEYPDAWWQAEGQTTRTNGLARVDLGVQALFERHDAGDRIAIVCHTQSGAALVSRFIENPFRHRYRLFSFENTGRTRLDRREGDRWLIKYANRINHLPERLLE